MKKSKIITIVIVVAVIGFFAFILLGKNPDLAYVPPTADEASSIKGCYVATLSKDVYTLSILSEEGENVSGNLSFKNFEKDSSSGTFTGTYKDGILLGDYSFDSEGSHSVMQVIFKAQPDGFVRGYGDVDSTGQRFTDLSNITYDDSAVFRKSPNCIVSTTTTTTDTNTWRTFSDTAEKITFKYPESLGTTYINPVDWPPKLETKNAPLTCVEAGQETARAGQTSKQTINGKAYCITKISEGAAGSTYTQYAYATQIQNKTFFLTFSLRSVQCANYDNPQKTACEKERATFSIDSIIDKIAGTIVQA
ncbi:MAG TPA: hypothetical protein VGO63_03265 [Candidatus Paceibacterota bacterium]|jgi:hypothetical protein|nr:hypothetical protein [Candidatus Paceibacterota bacterium]